MLFNIDIKNVAVIENISFAPQNGMCVLTGETGAGKSVLIDCVNMLLGARTNKNLVRHGENKASVSGAFSTSDELLKLLLDAGIEADDEIIINREITDDGKSIARINGNMVTASFLREIAPYLIDIHGQHDNQLLLNSSRHIDFLDSYAGINDLRNEYHELYNKLKVVNNEIKLLNQNEHERLSRIDLLKYQTEELTNACLKDGEEEKLKEESVLISSSEKLCEKVLMAYSNLYDNDNNAYDYINMAVKALREVSDLDKSLSVIYEKLTDALYTIEDSASELRSFADKTEYDEERLEEISNRLDLIKKLERKYGATIKDCLKFLENASQELNSLLNSDEKTEELIKERDEIIKNMTILSASLNKKRRKSAEELSLKIENELHELEMPKAKFTVDIKISDEFKPYGTDIVEFMITANPGQPFKELSKIASGGELSRIMLAMKTVLCDNEGADTLIFDEIDTGVSGNVALKIAKKLSALGKTKQVICVSHLPQIAAAGDNNYKIEKIADDNITKTQISLLGYDERLLELARMIDGENITKASLEHAKEMLERSF